VRKVTRGAKRKFSLGGGMLFMDLDLEQIKKHQKLAIREEKLRKGTAKKDLTL